MGAKSDAAGHSMGRPIPRFAVLAQAQGSKGCRYLRENPDDASLRAASPYQTNNSETTPPENPLTHPPAICRLVISNIGVGQQKGSVQSTLLCIPRQIWLPHQDLQASVRRQRTSSIARNVSACESYSAVLVGGNSVRHGDEIGKMRDL